MFVVAAGVWTYCSKDCQRCWREVRVGGVDGVEGDAEVVVEEVDLREERGIVGGRFEGDNQRRQTKTGTKREHTCIEMNNKNEEFSSSVNR